MKLENVGTRIIRTYLRLHFQVKVPKLQFTRKKETGQWSKSQKCYDIGGLKGNGSSNIKDELNGAPKIQCLHCILL